MVDAWLDGSDCWADFYDDHEEMQACEVNPDLKSTLGLCAEHEAEIMATASGPKAST
jgi:hypothetical protein